MDKKEKKGRISQEELLYRFEKAAKGEYILIGPLPTHTREKILIKHLVCGREYEISYHNFVAGNRCALCQGKLRLTIEEIDRRVQERYFGKIKLISTEYKNNKQQLTFQCTTCGKIFRSQPYHVMRGDSSCPYCTGRMSYGEVMIEELLKKLKVDYRSEVMFDDCMNKRHLKFDFGVYKNNILQLLIEFDGDTHRRNIFGPEKLAKQEINDKIKDQYCLDHGIELIRLDSLDVDAAMKRLQMLQPA